MDYMTRALDLAERAKGSCNPNPAVGAVLVRDGRIVGEGFTQARGEAHAEVVALRQAGPEANGATLFVTLEPCVHQGFTGPCTELIIEAGVREVRCSMLDPSAWVNGRGKGELERHGVRVGVGEGANVARRLNQDYVHWITTGRPFVTAKYAMSLDGKIATRTGSSRWISGDTARALVGQMRSRADAALVGISTVLADNPNLTARCPDGSLLARQPLRVVLDSGGRLPASAKVADGSLPGRTLVATTPAGRERLSAWASDSIEVWASEPSSDGRVKLDELLAALGGREIISVLVEAGGTLLGAFFEQRLIDEVAAFIAPKLVGGMQAPSPLGGCGVDDAAAATELFDVTYERLGADVLVRGLPRWCSPVS
jgi:diaminohydroxyphosphoribosylaminopyrimidine deaminase / 5-amino-6-(5-phosphoribosylamino)uracil reductase